MRMNAFHQRQLHPFGICGQFRGCPATPWGEELPPALQSPASASYHGMYGFCVGFAALQNMPFLGCKAAGQPVIHQGKEGGGK